MEIRCVDLYEYFGVTGPEGHAGILTLWHHATSKEVSHHRRRPAVLILPVFFDIDGIWFSITAAELLATGVTLLFLFAMRKKYRYM